MIHVFQLGLVLLFFWVGYREAENFDRDKGVYPWGLSPLIWGIIAGFSLLLGALLITIAKRTTQIPVPVARVERNISGSDWGASPTGQSPVAGDASAPYFPPPSTTILPPR